MLSALLIWVKRGLRWVVVMVVAGREGGGSTFSLLLLLLFVSVVAMLDRSFELDAEEGTRLKGTDGSEGSGMLSALLSWLRRRKLVLAGIWVIRGPGREGLGAAVKCGAGAEGAGVPGTISELGWMSSPWRGG